MAELITDRDLRHAIESVIRHAKTFIFIVSPYIELDEDTIKAFMYLKPEVVKLIVYRHSDKSGHKSGISKNSREFLNTLSNVEMVAVKKLHAKFYANEELGLISSMNLTKSSNHNYEMGIEVYYDSESETYLESLDYILNDILLGQDSNMDLERIKNIIPKRPFILETSAKTIFINGEEIDLKTFRSFHDFCNAKHGYCIRCSGTELAFYPNQPYCPKCFSEWNKFKNPEYEEKFCHRCGMESKTEINEPLCDNCVEVYEFEIEREWKKINLKEQKA